MRGQKIFLGLFLCLSNITIIVPRVQVSGVRFPHTTDFGTVWKTFWQEFEASISVITVFFTAFRSLLGLNALILCEKKKRP